MLGCLKSYFRAVIYIITFIALSMITTIVTLAVLSSNKTVLVPDIKGMDVIEATKVLEKKGLLLKIVDGEHDKFIKPGFIVRQEKAPGTIVKNGRGIRVYLSKGAAISSMPSYEGLSLNIVERLLIQSGSKIRKKLFVHSDDIMKGRIVAHRPMPGEPGEVFIDVLVSLGPFEDPLYKCPDFVNMSKEEAEELAEVLGITLRSDTTGTIVQDQSPKPDSIIKKESVVNITFQSHEEVTDWYPPY